MYANYLILDWLSFIGVGSPWCFFASFIVTNSKLCSKVLSVLSIHRMSFFIQQEIGYLYTRSSNVFIFFRRVLDQHNIQCTRPYFQKYTIYLVEKEKKKKRVLRKIMTLFATVILKTRGKVSFEETNSNSIDESDFELQFP